MKIWKYTLQPGFTKLSIPTGGRVLSVQAQHGEPRIWVLVDPEAPPEAREFMVYGTGHNVPDKTEKLKGFVGTIQMAEGTLVFHVFETISGT